MNYFSVFYWLTVADGVKNVFDTFSNIFTLFTVLSLLIYLFIIGIGIDQKTNGKEEDYKDTLLWRKLIGRFYWISQIICIITWLGYVFTPTKKDCLLIVAGGSVGNFITNDSSAKSIPSDITKFLHLSLNKEIDDLSKDVKTDIRKELGVQTPKDKLLDGIGKMTKEQIIEYIKNDSTTFSLK
jgi:hypothetical protein